MAKKKINVQKVIESVTHQDAKKRSSERHKGNVAFTNPPNQTLNKPNYLNGQRVNRKYGKNLMMVTPKPGPSSKRK